MQQKDKRERRRTCLQNIEKAISFIDLEENEW